MLRDEGAVIFASVDGRLEGAFLIDDPIRPEAARAIRGAKRQGIGEVVMVSGDHATVAEAVGAALGIDRVIPECSPEEKVEAVAASRTQHVTVMVGDGVNDAPALAAADVGVAMGARGSTSSSEAADMVLVVDRLDRLVEALSISRRSRGIAVQSITLGMGLSLAAMGFAAFGYLTPVLGALLQEGIDVVSIANALRALRGGRGEAAHVRVQPEVLANLRMEHQRLAPRIEKLRTTADGIEELAPGDAIAALRSIKELMADVVLPHERRDEMEIYPLLGSALGGDDPLAAMSRTHQEIFHLGRKLERFIEAVSDGPIEPGDATDARRLLYALHAILQLNIAQEEELFELLGDGQA
jgi:soluble P-type ATPase